MATGRVLSQEPPTGGSLGVDKWCLRGADSESIVEATADRKRLEQSNEIGAGLRVQDRQSDQDGIDEALHCVIAPTCPARETSISQSGPDTLRAKSVSRCKARRDRPCHFGGWPAGYPPDDRSSRALAPRRPSATAGSTGWPGACPRCGRRETAGRDTRQAWEGTRGRA